MRAAQRVAARRAGALQAARRRYTFASKGYAATFGNKPPVDHAAIRAASVRYLEKFDKQAWYDDPVCTMIEGKVVPGGDVKTTVDAFNFENGKQVLATSATVDNVIAHAKKMNARCNKDALDLREKVRRVEDRMLSDHAAALVGNQAVDFHKQDGITEIEEAIEANCMERRLNDQLLAAADRGDVELNRNIALIGCVSNFSNFLDLCKKTLRSMELGTPILVLSRSNTTQHMYRWVQLLYSEMEKEGLDLSLLTYVSCSIEEQRRIMSALSDSPFYLTGSREVAALIKELMPHTFSSTGGPNTMVVPELNSETEGAVRMSTTIENSGQCTAMRHLVVPQCGAADVERIFSGVKAVESSKESLEAKGFDAMFRSWAKSFQPAAGYSTTKAVDGTQPVAYRIAKDLPAEIDEHWRRVYLDVSTPQGKVSDPAFLSNLSRWLTRMQPITLAVNGDNEEAGFPMAQQLFRETAQVVYSVGRKGNPSLTAQARPQDGEIFGEFPPRREMSKYTRSPVYTPSCAPGYMARYTSSFLTAAAGRISSALGAHAEVRALLEELPNRELAGYGALLAEYLHESCGPKVGGGVRTALWGLQRPPQRDVSTILRARGQDDFATVVLNLVPFLVTNAREGLVVSADAQTAARLSAACKAAGVPLVEEAESAFEQRCRDTDPWNVVTAEEASSVSELPLVDHFVLKLFPAGHIKSTTPNDTGFVQAFESSSKWLRFIE